MNRPTFFILGTSKAGTTSLHHYLSQHPDILMSDPKEPPYFRLEYERGPEYYWRTYYRRWSGQREVGDGSPQNLYLPFVAPRIAAAVPDARLIVLCRHPVERAISAWWHNSRAGLEPLPFDAAIDRNLQRLERGPIFADEAEAKLYAEVDRKKGNAGLQQEFGFYVEPGYYAEAIDRYASFFGRDRLLVLFFEDLARGPRSVTDEVVRFLGLEPYPIRDLAPQNEATSPGAARVVSVIARLPGVGSIAPEWRNRVRRWISKTAKGKARVAPQASPATRRMLTQHFQAHNERLARLTGRDLSAWNALPVGE
jgi:hypothetical protein